MDLDQLDLNDLAAFVRVVDAAGFSAAARALGLPKSSLSRRVARLERALALRLLQRTSRSFGLTEAGREVHERAAAALGALRDLAVTASARHDEPRGTVRLTAPPDVGAEVLPAMIARFVARYPLVRVEVELAPRAADLVADSFDLALRGGRQRDSSLVVRKLQEMPFRLFAAPAYLARAGEPRRAADLARHECVLHGTRRDTARWVLRKGRTDVKIQVRGRVGADDYTFVRRAAIEGAGIAALPELIGDQLVAAGALAPVLRAYHIPEQALYIVYPSRAHLPPKVTALRDFLLESFTAMAAAGGAPTVIPATEAQSRGP